MMGMPPISAHIIDPFCKLPSFWKWDKGIDINPEDETSNTTQYQEAFLKYVENEYCANHIRVAVIEHEVVPSNTLFPSATDTGSDQFAFDP